jgi:hypothetical protein
MMRRLLLAILISMTARGAWSQMQLHSKGVSGDSINSALDRGRPLAAHYLQITGLPKQAAPALFTPYPWKPKDKPPWLPLPLEVKERPIPIPYRVSYRVQPVLCDTFRVPDLCINAWGDFLPMRAPWGENSIRLRGHLPGPGDQAVTVSWEGYPYPSADAYLLGYILYRMCDHGDHALRWEMLYELQTGTSYVDDGTGDWGGYGGGYYGMDDAAGAPHNYSGGIEFEILKAAAPDERSSIILRGTSDDGNEWNGRGCLEVVDGDKDFVGYTGAVLAYSFGSSLYSDEYWGYEVRQVASELGPEYGLRLADDCGTGVVWFDSLSSPEAGIRTSEIWNVTGPSTRSYSLADPYDSCIVLDDASATKALTANRVMIARLRGQDYPYLDLFDASVGYASPPVIRWENGDYASPAFDVSLWRSGTNTLSLGTGDKSGTGTLSANVVGSLADTSRYSADSPRPYGWPQTGTHAWDHEFSGEPMAAWHWYDATHNPAGGGDAQAPYFITQDLGYLHISNNGIAYSGAYLAIPIGVISGNDGFADVALSFVPDTKQGTVVGLYLLGSSGTGFGVNCKMMGMSHQYWNANSVTDWGFPLSSNANPTYGGGPMYLRYLHYPGGLYELSGSVNGLSWFTVTNGFDTSDLAYLAIPIAFPADTSTMYKPAIDINWVRWKYPNH